MKLQIPYRSLRFWWGIWTLFLFFKYAGPLIGFWQLGMVSDFIVPFGFIGLMILSIGWFFRRLVQRGRIA
jgi:hypothetical protein